MYIVLDGVRHVKVNHVTDIWDVETSSCNLSCHQNVLISVPELVQGVFTHPLRFVAVNADNTVPFVFEDSLNLLGIVLCSYEHENSVFGF